MVSRLHALLTLITLSTFLLDFQKLGAHISLTYLIPKLNNFYSKLCTFFWGTPGERVRPFWYLNLSVINKIRFFDLYLVYFVIFITAFTE